MDAVVEILKGLDYSPLYVSLKTGIVATIFSFFLGLFAARRVIKAGPKVKAIADGILTLPMVLPPTVAPADRLDSLCHSRFPLCWSPPKRFQIVLSSHAVPPCLLIRILTLGNGRCCRGTRKVFLPSIQNSLKALYFLDFRAFSPAQLSPCSLAFRGINSHIFSLKSSTKSSKLRGKSAFYYSPFATLFNSSFASSYPKWV
mgnify:CR=1 FL=1